MLYRILSFSVKHQQELAIESHMSLPSQHPRPSPSPPHPSRLSQSPSLSFLSPTENSHWLFYIWNCKFPCYSLHISHLLPHPTNPRVHRAVLYVCFSMVTLQINSSISISRFNTYASAYNISLFLSDFMLYNRL